MTFSKQLYSLFFLFLFLFPLRHASKPKKCSSSFSRPNRCGYTGVPIRFPFCGHPGFNLRCNNLKNTVLELPISGTFLVDQIKYGNQQIYIKDPENCLVKRLLTFNTSGSPFYSRPGIFYTFLNCPNELILSSWYPSISCLSNSTSSFFVTSNSSLAESMLPSCQIVKTLNMSFSRRYEESNFSSYINDQSILLEWDSPNCEACERQNLRCGFKNKDSQQIKCFKDGLSKGVLITIICLSIIGGATLFATCIAIRIRNYRRYVSRRRWHAAITASIAAQHPREFMAPRGLDQSTVESYKKLELGDSRRLPGNNGIVCPICLSEYASKEILRVIPECDHCFHLECIDPWLKIHGSCPLCRNSRP